MVSLCVSAVENTIASGSLDKSIRFWDLRSANCQGLINVKGNPMAAFDPDGLVLAAGVNSDTLMLYDLRYLNSFVCFFYNIGMYLSYP